MSDRVRLYLSACFYYSGLVKLVRWCTQRAQPRLIILYYHQAAGGDLRSHWLYLRRHYRILPLEAALDELSHSVQEKDQRTMLAVTFDDGYEDNYTHAFPLARELQVPITIFLVSEYIANEKNNAFWWATRLLRLAQVEQVTLEEQTYHLKDLEARKALAHVIADRFGDPALQPHEGEALAAQQRLRLNKELEQFLAMLSRLLELPSSFVLKEKPAPLLTWSQVREMHDSGWVSFGAHTLHHPDLATLIDPAEVQSEIGQCRPQLEQQFGHPVQGFAYPFGSIGDYGPFAVEQAGYAWAVTTRPGSNTCRTDPHFLMRRKMDTTKHWLVVAAETAGIWGFFSRLKSSARRLIRP